MTNVDTKKLQELIDEHRLFQKVIENQQSIINYTGNLISRVRSEYTESDVLSAVKSASYSLDRTKLSITKVRTYLSGRRTGLQKTLEIYLQAEKDAKKAVDSAKILDAIKNPSKIKLVKIAKSGLLAVTWFGKLSTGLAVKIGSAVKATGGVVAKWFTKTAAAAITKFVGAKAIAIAAVASAKVIAVAAAVAGGLGIYKLAELVKAKPKVGKVAASWLAQIINQINAQRPENQLKKWEQYDISGKTTEELEQDLAEINKLIKDLEHRCNIDPNVYEIEKQLLAILYSRKQEIEIQLRKEMEQQIEQERQGITSVRPASGSTRDTTYTMRENGMHWGADILGDRGESIKATYSGRVIFPNEAGRTFSGSIGEEGQDPNADNVGSGYGYLVIIETDMKVNGHPVHIYYAHLESASPLNYGDRVEAGDAIGNMGNTGTSFGDGHLHYEVRIHPYTPYKEETVVDPRNYLPPPPSQYPPWPPP